jgi:hypothetical protein
MGAVNNITGALTTALSDWSATIGGTTEFINKSESTLATPTEDTRRIVGWRPARETGWAFFSELLSAFSNIAGSLDGWFLQRAQPPQNTLVGDSLENCPGLASNKDVGFLFLDVRVRIAQKTRRRSKFGVKLDEIVRTVGRICGGVALDQTIAPSKLTSIGVPAVIAPPSAAGIL